MKRSSAPSSLAKKGKYTQKKTIKQFRAVPRPLVQYKTGFPKQLAMTHKYTQGGSMVWTPPTVNALVSPWGVNCMYDPYLFVGGGQPLYFDQMTTIYNHYTVMKSRMKVTIIPNTVVPFVAGICIDDDGSTGTQVLDNFTQQPSSVYTVSQRDAQVVTLYKSWDCKSVFGPSPLDNDTLQGNAAANPTEIQAYLLFVRPVDQTATSTTFDFYVTIEYDAIWHELKQVGIS